MEGKELRVGNYVMCRNFPVFGHNIPVDWSVAQVSAEGIAIADKFEPIPITDEWLLKFGFINTETGWKIIYRKQFEFSVILINKFASVGIAGPFGLFQVKLKYVHQLQNLYFALFGEELTLQNDGK